MKITHRFYWLPLSLLLFLAPVYGGGPLIICNPGQPFLWPGGGAGITFNPDQGDLGPLNQAAAVALVSNAFQVWQNVPTSTISYVQGASLPVDVDITNFGPWLSPAAPDGLSAIVFDDTGQIFDLLFGPGSGILGFAGPEWVDTVACTVTEGVSFLNGPTFSNPTEGFDVMVHEIGHFSGLAHTIVNGQIYIGDNSGPTPNDTFLPIPPPFGSDVVETMYPFYFGAGIGTGSLEADDIAIISRLYPAAGYFAGVGAIQGRVVASDARTRVTGVNVIARNIADPFEDAVSAITSDFTDNVDQSDPIVGTYSIYGLTPGADYAVYIDGIQAGGFSTDQTIVLTEEFFNRPNESFKPTVDDPAVFTPVPVFAGSVTGPVNIIYQYVDAASVDMLDDSNIAVGLSFRFKFCGSNYSAAFINSNGSVTFGGPDNNPVANTANHLDGLPRIVGYWTDLNQEDGGTIDFDLHNSSIEIDFDSVPEWTPTGMGGGSNTFEVLIVGTSTFSGVRIVYGVLDAQNGVVGFSCGGAVTTGSEAEVDFSSFAGSTFDASLLAAHYEEFSANDNDLDNLGFKIILPQ